MRGVRFVVGLAITLLLAAALRLPQLSIRPMHCDEAVHADKLNELLTTGRYVYDPHEYHGPTLYYATLPICWLRGAATIADLDERDLRIVPVIFGLATIALLPLIVDGIGRCAALIAGLLLAVSPAMVFYSRYYIQETLLVFFTFLAIAAGWRYVQSRRSGWALLCGVSVGLMHATKETCVIALGCAAAALFAAWFLGRKLRHPQGREAASRRRSRGRFPNGFPGALLVAVPAAAITSAAMFSVFFTHARGPLDSVQTFATYFDRAGNHGLHDHPWWFYAQRLLYAHFAPGPTFSEAAIVALACVGLVACLRTPLDEERRGAPFRRFLAWYTLLLTVVYCAIPYKTPWCALGFLHGMILLAGVGGACLLGPLARRWFAIGERPNRGEANRVFRIVFVSAALGFAVWHLASQARLASIRESSSNRNPYVYAHPLRDVVDVGAWLERLADANPAGRAMRVHVIMDNPWPIPWYLRRLLCVGYWETPPDELAAPVIIVDDALRDAAQQRLGESWRMHVRGFMPGVRIAVFVHQDAQGAFLEASRRTAP